MLIYLNISLLYRSWFLHLFSLKFYKNREEVITYKERNILENRFGGFPVILSGAGMILWMFVWVFSCFEKEPFKDRTPPRFFNMSFLVLASAICLWQSAFQNCLSYDIVCMTSWTSLNETSCWVISVLIIFQWRKAELSLSWKLTFVLIKASMLVPDQFNWQVWCPCFVLSLYRSLCTDLALWFGALVSTSRSSALAANDLAHCQKCLFLSHYFSVLCGGLMTLLSHQHFLFRLLRANMSALYVCAW